MKLIRLTLAALFLSVVGACSNPVVPRYPPEDDKQEPGEGERPGFLFEAPHVFWV